MFAACRKSMRWVSRGAAGAAVVALALIIWRVQRPQPVDDFGPASPAARDPSTPCGAVSAAVVARYLGKDIALRDAARLVRSDPFGRSSMGELIEGLHEMGLAAVGVQLNCSAMRLSTLPMILHLDDMHYVAAIPYDGRNVTIVDPPSAPRIVPITALPGRWAGNAVLVGPENTLLARAMDRMGGLTQ